MQLNKQKFWNEKILGWENDKYLGTTGLGRAVNINRSLQVRRKIALASLAPLAKDATVVEAGCGSGLLLEAFLKLGVKKYIGIDFSSAAISKAKERIPPDQQHRVEFRQEDIGLSKQIKCDVVFSLGLLDWLSETEVESFLSTVQARYHLHSFSEQKRSIAQFLHKAYVYILYGHNNSEYTPNYYPRETVSRFFKKSKTDSINFFSSNYLEFGCLAHNLPKINE
ncbi:MAG: class I SAM-dependent methyltransferase [Halobacteriovoraceae bacterium]|jgi:SAM-dependent methyltransferase|nr:class I SAM-dependent methyltransferase [Halobacteriovoraceae bacterium]